VRALVLKQGTETSRLARTVGVPGGGWLGFTEVYHGCFSKLAVLDASTPALLVPERPGRSLLGGSHVVLAAPWALRDVDLTELISLKFPWVILAGKMRMLAAALFGSCTGFGTVLRQAGCWMMAFLESSTNS
jgi:hypothetical protein